MNFDKKFGNEMTYTTLKRIAALAITTLTPTLGSDFMSLDSQTKCLACQQPLSCHYLEKYRESLVSAIRTELCKEVSETTKVGDILPPVTFTSIIDGKESQETLGMAVEDILYHRQSSKTEISPRSGFKSIPFYDVEIRVGFLKVLPHGGTYISASLGICFSVKI